MQDKIKTAKVVMGRAMQLQEHQMMQEREREYNQALDHAMDQQRLEVSHWACALPQACLTPASFSQPTVGQHSPQRWALSARLCHALVPSIQYTSELQELELI